MIVSEKKKSLRWVWVFFLFFCFVLSLTSFPERVISHSGSDHKWAAPQDAAQRSNPVPRDDASINSGKKLFKKYCAICHGTSAKGDGPGAASLDPKPSDLAQTAGEHPDGDIAWKISTGRGPMPGWGKQLSEKDIWELTNFIQSLKP